MSTKDENEIVMLDWGLGITKEQLEKAEKMMRGLDLHIDRRGLAGLVPALLFADPHRPDGLPVLIARRPEDDSREDNVITLVAPEEYADMPKSFKLDELYLQTKDEKWMGRLVWERKGLRKNDIDNSRWFLGFSPA